MWTEKTWWVLCHIELSLLIPNTAGTVTNKSTTRDNLSMAMYTGQGVGLIKEILPAGEVVNRLVRRAKLLIRNELDSLIDWSISRFLNSGVPMHSKLHHSVVFHLSGRMFTVAKKDDDSWDAFGNKPTTHDTKMGVDYVQSKCWKNKTIMKKLNLL